MQWRFIVEPIASRRFRSCCNSENSLGFIVISSRHQQRCCPSSSWRPHKQVATEALREIQRSLLFFYPEDKARRQGYCERRQNSAGFELRLEIAARRPSVVLLREARGQDCCRLPDNEDSLSVRPGIEQSLLRCGQNVRG